MKNFLMGVSVLLLVLVGCVGAVGLVFTVINGLGLTPQVTPVLNRWALLIGAIGMTLWFGGYWLGEEEVDEGPNEEGEKDPGTDG